MHSLSGRGRPIALGLVTALLAAACGSDATPTTTTTTTAAEPSVTLTTGSIEWETYDYELTRFNTIAAGSFDGETRTTQTLDTLVLENEHLVVTLVPGFGGRIISIVNKATGREQLYRNPLGVPYQIDTGVFYFDWLMVYGGIFPTFPEPEHGKTWFLPWDVEVIEASDEVVTVAMSFVDDESYPLAPRRYSPDASGLEVTYTVTLHAGRAAVDTTVTITNPADHPVSYEYWTNATLAPGSDPADPRTTARAEIIAPIDLIEIPRYWTGIASAERATGLADVYEFDTLRQFRNWPDLGIAYAFPDVADATYWGVIDHETTEGIIRVADNTITPGLKLWTWGYPQTAGTDPTPAEARPYVEMWAGVTRQFFLPTEIAPGASLSFDETWLPSTGLAGITHATTGLLADLRTDGAELVVDLWSAERIEELTVDLEGDGIVLDTAVLHIEAATPVSVRFDDPGTDVTLIFDSPAGTTALEPPRSRSG